MSDFRNTDERVVGSHLLGMQIVWTMLLCISNSPLFLLIPEVCFLDPITAVET